MGIFIAAVLPLPEDLETLDWDAVARWLAAAEDAELIEGLDPLGYDSTDLEDERESVLAEIREIYTDLQNEILTESESATLEVGGHWALFSGGMSGGDHPTEACATIFKAWGFPGALRAIGFPV